MFKREDEVISFVDYLEKFIIARVVGDAAALNKARASFEEYLKELSGIVPSKQELDSLNCPDCGAMMKLRTNRQNGNKFWGCSKYPDCKGTRDENGLSKAEREEAKYKKEQTEQQDGFSFNRDKRSPATEVAPPVQDTGWVNPFTKR